MRNKRAAFQMSFGWIFAIIVGMTILFLAIYGVTKLINNSEGTSNIETSKEFETLLNPLETGVESGSSVSLNFPAETRVYNICDGTGNFGLQGISVSQKSFNKWSEPSTEILFKNRYIFSDNVTEGKKFYLFSKPFDLPYKVSDVIYMTSADIHYCFLNPPDSIKTEVLSLNQANLHVDECPSKSINICFSHENNCDIDVVYDSNRVVKNGQTSYFIDDATMYASIFSDKLTYSCQLQRLMKRASVLAEIYGDKAQYLTARGCSFNIQSDLISLGSLGKSYSNDVSYVNEIKDLSSSLEDKNNMVECRLW